MHDLPIEPMNAQNVNEFDIWIFDSEDLVASVVPHRAPERATTEDYEMGIRTIEDQEPDRL